MKRTRIRRKTVLDASLALPPETRYNFVRAFRATRCMDLYAGDLAQYVAVITGELERYIRQAEATDRAVQAFLVAYKKGGK